MADNFLRVSNYVPLNYVDVNRSLPDVYHTKHFDGYMNIEQIQPWEVYDPNSIQKWQKDDIIFLQFKSNFDPINIKLRNVFTGGEYEAQQLAVVANINGTIYTQGQHALTNIPEGVYQSIVEAGDPVLITLESEPFLVKQTHAGTILFRYNGNRNDTMLWQTGIYCLLRVDGIISLADYVPVGNRTVYVDTPRNTRTVQGKSGRNFMLRIGGNGLGTPNYIPDKMQDIFDLPNVEIDGKGFSAVDAAAKLEPTREVDCAFAGWQMLIAETNNRREKLFEVDGLQEQKVVIDYNTESKAFGPVDGDANDNSYTLNKVE